MGRVVLPLIGLTHAPQVGVQRARGGAAGTQAGTRAGGCLNVVKKAQSGDFSGAPRWLFPGLRVEVSPRPSLRLLQPPPHSGLRTPPGSNRGPRPTRGGDSGTWGRGWARPWPGAAPRPPDGGGQGCGMGGGGVRWRRRRRTPPGMPAGALSSAHLGAPRARCADGRGGDTPSCHRRCPGLSQRAGRRSCHSRAGRRAASARARRSCGCRGGPAPNERSFPTPTSHLRPPWAFAASAAPPARGWLAIRPPGLGRGWVGVV